MRGSARGCWGALVILRELPDRGSEWFPSNVARNSHACILGFEIRSLELQRLWPISKNDRVKLRATFGGVVSSVTFGPLCQAPPLCQALPLHRPCPFTGSAPPHLQGCSRGGTPQGPASMLPRPSCRRAWLVACEPPTRACKPPVSASIGAPQPRPRQVRTLSSSTSP